MRSNRRQLQLSFYDTDVMVSESIDFLCKHEPEEGYYVGFSGGKDSICALNLCRMAGVKHKAFYSCTRIDPPEVVRFIKEYYPDVGWLFPKMTFWQGIKTKMPPLRIQRWCCDVLKKDPGKDHPLKHRVMGIRSEESTRRASRPRIDEFKKYKQKVYKPIFGWNEYHVWSFIEQNGLAYPSLYDEGFHRIGCVVCPFMMGPTKSKVLQRGESRLRWPGIWKAFESSCRTWFDGKKGDSSMPDEKFEDWYQRYLNGFEEYICSHESTKLTAIRKGSPKA